MTTSALAAPRSFLADLQRRTDATVLTQAIGIVAFAALAALGAQMRVYLWEVPITFQTAAVYGAGLMLGARNGALAMALYLAVGLVAPVFAGDAYGLGYLTTSASAGYLLAYPLVAAIIGGLTARRRTFVGSGLAMAAGMVVLFTCGVVWLHGAAGHATWRESILKGAVLFIVWDLAKVWLMAGANAGLRRLAASA